MPSSCVVSGAPASPAGGGGGGSRRSERARAARLLKKVTLTMCASAPTKNGKFLDHQNCGQTVCPPVRHKYRQLQYDKRGGQFQGSSAVVHPLAVSLGALSCCTPHHITTAAPPNASEHAAQPGQAGSQHLPRFFVSATDPFSPI